MKNAEIKNFHLPMSEELYSRLREEAKRSHLPATSIARQALEDWLGQKERAALHHSIAEYARDQAGSEQDLDSELEAATLDHWLDPEAAQE